MKPIALTTFILEIRNSSMGHFNTTINNKVPDEIDKNTAFKTVFSSKLAITHPMLIPKGMIIE